MDAPRLWRRIKHNYGPDLPLSPDLFIVLFPFYWMVITAFKRDRDLYNLDTAPFWFKEPPTLDHIKLLWYGTLFPTWLENSLMIGVLVVFITLLLALPAAYALARMRFPGAQPLSTAMFLSYLIPSTLLFIPLSQVVRGLGFIDSVWALVIVYPSFPLALSVSLRGGSRRGLPLGGPRAGVPPRPPVADKVALRWGDAAGGHEEHARGRQIGRLNDPQSTPKKDRRGEGR